jgi:NhaP-type Na+/H+ or K+/H+ antiporter
MLPDSTATRVQDNDHDTITEDSTTGDSMLTQPLITTSHESSEDEGQRLLQKERQSKSIICKSFLLGCSIGFAVQVMVYAAYYTLFKIFGKDTTSTPWVSSYGPLLLYMISPTLYIAAWLTCMYTNGTKSGSLYTRKKFDKAAANPNPGSIWTARMLFMVSVYFLLGTTIGSFFLRFGAALHSGMVIPWVSVFGYTMINSVAYLVIVKWVDWAEQRPEDDYSNVV